MAIALDTLAYARRLREAGFSEEQAEGQAEALAAAMTDTLATKQDLQELETRMDARFRELEVRTDARFARVDTRFEYLEKHIDSRFGELTARFDGRLSDLEHRITLRMVAGIGVVSALVKLL